MKNETREIILNDLRKDQEEKYEALIEERFPYNKIRAERPKS